MKLFKKILPILVFTFVLVLPTVAFAADGKVDSLQAKSDDGKLTVTGKASGDVLSVAVLVYDESGKNLIDVGSTVVNDDKTFTRVVALPNGTYTVKAADYDGGDFTQALAKEESPTDDTIPDKTPGTADYSNPYLWITVFGVAVAVSGGAFVYKLCKQN